MSLDGLRTAEAEANLRELLEAVKEAIDTAPWPMLPERLRQAIKNAEKAP